MIMYVLQGTFRKLVIYHGSLAREDLQAAIPYTCASGGPNRTQQGPRSKPAPSTLASPRPAEDQPLRFYVFCSRRVMGF